MNVTVLGTGTMGSAMAANLSRAGLSTVVWNRTPPAAAALAAVGVTVASTVADAVRSADIAITMVADGNAVTSVAVNQGMLDSLPAGAIWVQMATIGLDATERMAALTAERRPDVVFVDAPVSGSKGPAERGELLVLASGPETIGDTLEPVFRAVGQRTIWLGEAGRGSRLKLVLNSWLAFLVEGLAESVALADGLGITRDELRQALSGGPLAAPAAIAKLAKIEADDYAPEFPLALALKDVDLALAATLRQLPGIAAIAEQWHLAVGQGLGDLDISAASLALQSAAGAIKPSAA